MDRVKYIAQKRSTLKTQITNLQNLIAQNKIDSINMKLRLNRITDLFHGYEELHDELAIIDPGNERLNEFDEIQDRYYELASKIRTAEGSSIPQNETLNQTSIQIDKTRRIKLPVAELPKFDGKIENWLSYKNTFLTMINSRDDITRLEKFIYLKNSLQGEALNKISIYNVSDENYENAWKLLLDSYEKTRVLIAKHLDAILELSVPTKSIPKGLTKLVDDTRQHITMLNSLNVHPDEHMLIRILERALPQHIRIKWEEGLSLEISPTLGQFYRFISETSFRLSTLEGDNSRSKSEQDRKRPVPNRDLHASKVRRIEPGTRALVSTTEEGCFLCKKEKHGLFKCPVFVKATLSRRWEIVNRARLCKNCLRSHQEQCPMSLCKICNRFHNTMLHNSKFTDSASHCPSRESANTSAPTESRTNNPR